MDSTLSEDEVRATVEHETVHYLDYLLPEGRRRLAIDMANANTHPRYVAEALAFDTFTELRAYGINGHPGIKGVEVMDTNVRRDPAGSRGPVMQLAPSIVANLWNAGLIHFDQDFQLTDSIRDAASVLLGELILRYRLLDRLPNY